jgi:hypothetical protein
MYKLYTIDLPEYNNDGFASYIEPFTSLKEAEEFAINQIKKWKPKDYPHDLMIVREVQFKDYIIESS